ncbi:MAG: HipA family kinase [Pseudomonadota bacterium]
MHELPVKALSVDPANLNTADVELICHCDDGQDYAVKTTTKNPHVPHSEWFCKHLGDRVGIASPPCRLVEVNGLVGFGSRWESGHKPGSWWMELQTGGAEKGRLLPTVNRIFAFDLFVNNIDRHGNNYLFRQQAGGWSLTAFDHSRAWLAVGWPLHSLPMGAHLNTVKMMRWLNATLGGILDIGECMTVINNLRSVDPKFITQILDCQDPSWLSTHERDTILMFWESSARQKRLDEVERGLKNGNYL